MRSGGVGSADERAASITVAPIKKCAGEIYLPGSKSLSNRALLLAALSEGTTRVDNLLDSDDVTYMLEALGKLGVKVEQVGDEDTRSFSVVGNGGAFGGKETTPAAPLELFLGNAGTAMRPLAAALALSPGSYVLDGVPRMRERPIADLVDGLKQLGVCVDCSGTGCPPVVITNPAGHLVVSEAPLTSPQPPCGGGTARISGQTSSQFISALLMAAPLASGPVGVEITDELISAPYVQLTSSLMAKFGVAVVNEGGTNSKFTVASGQQYTSPGTYFVEGDASSASYFLAAGALTGGPVTVVGCGADSTQGDVRFASVLEQMGATVEWGANSITVSRAWNDPGVGEASGLAPLRGVDVDCGDIPDAAMTLSVVALFADGPTAIRNVYSWRVKETERMAAIVCELGKLGVQVDESREDLVIYPPKKKKATTEGAPSCLPELPSLLQAVDTYDDHRMAMVFSLVACAGVPVVINDPKCVSKTFPDYFQKLASISEASISDTQTEVEAAKSSTPGSGPAGGGPAGGDDQIARLRAVLATL